MTNLPVPARPRSVLVVDDHADSARSLAVLLRALGFAADVESCGRNAVSRAAKDAPDVVVLELCLGGMDGWEVARQLRKSQCQTRLIALTTCGLADDRRRSHEAGIDFHLVKPACVTDLVNALAGVTTAPSRSVASACRYRDHGGVEGRDASNSRTSSAS